MKWAPWITLGVVATAMVAVVFVRNAGQYAKLDADAPPVPASTTTAKPMDARPARTPRRSMPTPQEIAQTRAERVRSLEARMVEEPRDGTWAANNEQHIDAFFAVDNLNKAGVPPVVSHDVECRTHVCRVRMRVESDLGTDQATQALLQHIADALPNAQIFQEDDARGANIVVYAQSPSAAPSRGSPFGRSR
jgi:hypothetical protein